MTGSTESKKMRAKSIKKYVLIRLLLLYLTSNTSSSLLRLSCKTEGYFSIVIENFGDREGIIRTVKAKGKRECVLECLSESTCKAVNFEKAKGNCELVGRGMTAALTEKPGWIYLTSKEEESNIGQTCKRLTPCLNGGTCTDKCSGKGFQCTCTGMYTGLYCQNAREFANCKAVYDAGFTTSGIYKLTNMGYHYCMMGAMGECSGTGWTLVMKTLGNSDVFKYSSSYWTSSNTYNHVYELKNGKNVNQEAKFDAFNKMPLTKICLAFDASGTRNFMQIPITATSMLSLINSGERATGYGRNKWLSMVSGSQLQVHCNAEGFNRLSRARIGIIGNNENDCASPDSNFGFGLLKRYCYSKTRSSGNLVCLHTINRNAGFDGLIFVQ